MEGDQIKFIDLRFERWQAVGTASTLTSSTDVDTLARTMQHSKQRKNNDDDNNNSEHDVLIVS